MKRILLILLLSAFNLVNSQNEKTSKMGQTTLDELKMTVYNQDSTATAVVLYEHANYYIDVYNNYEFRTDYYFRIKILDKASFNLADIEISQYKKQKVIDISGITYNLKTNGTTNETRLNKKDIFTVNERKNLILKKFTLPNIKKGSVIEYSYSILSPYLSIDDWYFQSEIPKIKSQFDAAILGNYKYNIRKIGYLDLDKKDNSIKKNCVYFDGLGQGACSIYSFEMRNIPAFKEEDFMLSKDNYLSRISFDLKSATSFRGSTKKYATTWKEADNSIKKFFFNNQTSKKSFFRKNLSEDILNTNSTIKRAEKIYTFIKDHYTWNKRFWTNEDAKIKQAFEEKSGDVGEINLSLYNALRAANINADLVVLSTRNHKIPTKIYPIIFDYNYVIVKAEIEGKNYFLDATDSFLPFGQLPVRTLNGEARVINFKKEGEWIILKPKYRSSKNISANLKLNEKGDITGKLMIRRRGYLASDQRKKLSLRKEESYLEEFENKHPFLEVQDYELHQEKELHKPLTEIFTIKVNSEEELTNKVRINPFLFNRVKENPFKLKERNYPVDFGYGKKTNFYLNLKIPENYIVKELPKNKAISLPNNGGRFILKTVKSKNTVNISVRLYLSKKVFFPEEYSALKEFFKQIIIAENNYMILEKKK